MLSRLKLKLAILLNRLRRKRGPALRDQCAAVVMKMCALQLEKEEFRELAAIKGSYGNFAISGGAITVVKYQTFDRNADKLDKTIRDEPWRAFANVKMYVTLDKDPTFEVEIDGKQVDPEPKHTSPGLTLLKHLSTYFPLIAKPYTGPISKGAGQ